LHTDWRVPINFIRKELEAEMDWVRFISVETVPKVGKNDQIFSTKPSGRSSFNSFETHPKDFNHGNSRRPTKFGGIMFL
jgi:hypothetical protein